MASITHGSGAARCRRIASPFTRWRPDIPAAIAFAASTEVTLPVAVGREQRRKLVEEFMEMPFIITDPCIGTKDAACIDVCPVDCIHPRKDEPEFEQATMLYIHPEECIDCGACVPACPVAAIYDSVEATPSHQTDLIEANSIYRSGDPGAMARAEAIVQVHIARQPTLMAIPPAERQAAHAVQFTRSSSE